MSGDRIALAVQALKLFIHSLPIGSKFNIISYGTTYKKMFEEGSVKYCEKTLDKANILLK
jgi:hypothetical protein